MISTCNTLTVVLLLLTFSSLQIFHVSSFEFTVGDTTGWVVPPSNDTKMYNDWASENRFQVGDSIHFKYRKDSVMEVSEAEYKKCNSTHPNFFSNTGNTVFELDRSGAFYFISGAAGHCTRGQRMIIKVMSPEDSRGGNSTSGAALLLSNGLVLKLVFIQFLLSYVASCLL
ncbi:early nodulin-like protein 5 [Cornus florida]|uniref:early nodulin-like protein 5 n=1 Tax=Cornus florida TaxID=4283 RepID=UPI0028A205B4|nr:early nodulin-like protein 5 [Cornus florida]